MAECGYTLSASTKNTLSSELFREFESHLNTHLKLIALERLLAAEIVNIDRRVGLLRELIGLEQHDI